MDHENNTVKEYRLKVVVVGSQGTGKTAIIKRYVNNSFAKTYKATIGVDFALKIVDVDPKTKVHLQLWDIAGQERFGSMTKIFYKKAVGGLVVFDITDQKTFQAVDLWVGDIREKLRPKQDIPLLLLGNKCDLKDVVVTEDQIKSIAEKHGFIGWRYTSAKDSIGINETIDKLLEEILKNIRTEAEEETDVVTLENIKPPNPPPNETTCTVCAGGGGE